MTPQEAATMLREWYIAFDRYGKGNERTVKELLDISDLMEDLDKRIPRWISVHDKLPGMDEKVLFIPACNPRSVYIGKLKYVGEANAVYFVVNNWRRTVTYSATHWMPRPKTLEEENDATG